ncbi:putative Pectate lyase family protein [Hibiscus syriacus]|uniref:Pectate lyase family protein n=1 Tax=Hibiscus syriacus TaxID=106335 RepID=A0A6A3BH91_HIBSY|nr:putative Pectate lyase family protein [Hibiscus syriacus]
MELVTAKSKSSPGRTHSFTVKGNAIDTKCIKRRRRDHSNGALGCNNQQLQGDQPIATTVKRSSRFRGVSRFEAHLWDKASWNPTQRKKGKQVFSRAYDEEESAARAYDLAAIKRSSGFSRGVSRYRGVARHHHNGRWEGGQCSTNFDLSTYIRWLKPGANEALISDQIKTAAASKPLPPTSNFFPAEQINDLALFNSNAVSRCPNSSSVPSTALSLLLRSSNVQQTSRAELECKLR